VFNLLQNVEDEDLKERIGRYYAARVDTMAGQTLFALGEPPEEWIPLYEKALAADAVNLPVQREIADFYYANGEEYLSVGLLREAESSFLHAIRWYPHDLDFYRSVAQVSRQRDDGKVAIEVYRLALEVEPENTYLRMDLGTLYGVLGQLDESEAEFRTLLVDEDRLEADLKGTLYRNLANIHRLRGEREEAVSLYQKALDVQRNQADAGDIRKIIEELNEEE